MIDYASVTRSFVMWRNEKKILVLPSQVIAKIIDQILRNNRWHFELFKTYMKVIFSYVAQALCNASSNGGGWSFLSFFVFLSSKCWSKGAFFYAVVGVNTIHLFPGPTEAAPLIPFQIRRPRFWTLRKQKFKKRRSTHKVQECRIRLWKPARRPPRGPRAITDHRCEAATRRRLSNPDRCLCLCVMTQLYFSKITSVTTLDILFEASRIFFNAQDPN